VAGTLIPAVFDSNVIVGGSLWRGQAYLCLVCMARRRVRVFTSGWIVEEVRRSVTRLQESGLSGGQDPWPIVNWFAATARVVTPSPTGKQRSRDPKDDPILGTALASGAKSIVTFDKDMLVLRKPFGIEVIHPAELLARLQTAI
jgi:putative PIN family toxin of toxin-antitoxin system